MKISGIIYDLDDTLISRDEAFYSGFTKKFYKKLNGKIPIIGVGGIDSGKSAFEKISAGASALQLFTAMIFKVPIVVKNINRNKAITRRFFIY